MSKRVNTKDSDYVDTLDSVSRQRYENKLQLIGGKDPYKLSDSEWKLDPAHFPDVAYPDIVNYLVFQTSAYSLEELKAYKSLEAYKWIVSGWIREVKSVEIGGKYVIIARMLHSQSLNEKPLCAWVIAEKEGTILTGHCTCRAGLGEVCSHVAATLFATDATVKIRDATTVTQSKAYWLLPAGIQKIDYRPVKDIDFRSAKTQKRHLDELIDSLSDESKRQKLHVDIQGEGQISAETVLHTPFSKGTRNVGLTLPIPPSAHRTRKPSTSGTPPPTRNELNNFYATLKGTGKKPVILSLVEGFQEDYIPVTQTSKFPKLLSELRDQKCIEMDKPELMSRCEEIFSDLKVTSEEAQNVETVTKKQTGCKEWFRFRSGRITASKFKAVCRTSIETPSQSLLKSICYPVTVKFRNKGADHLCGYRTADLRLCIRICKNLVFLV